MNPAGVSALRVAMELGKHVAWDKNVNEGPLFTMSGTAVRSPLLDRVYVSSPGMGRDAKSRIS